MKANTVTHYVIPTPLPGPSNRTRLRVRIIMEQQQKIEIGRRIYALRENGPHTNRSIADAVDVHERTVAYWIAGKTAPTWNHASTLADLFDVDVNWLWTGAEHKPGPTPDPFSQSAPTEAPDLAEKKAAARHAEVMLELAKIHTLLEAQETTGRQDEPQVADN